MSDYISGIHDFLSHSDLAFYILTILCLVFSLSLVKCFNRLFCAYRMPDHSHDKKWYYDKE